jgi:hypothetical protein
LKPRIYPVAKPLAELVHRLPILVAVVRPRVHEPRELVVAVETPETVTILQ